MSLALLLAATATAALPVVYLARHTLLPRAAAWLDVGQRPCKADYVFILGGQPSVRPFVAAALVRMGLAENVLISDASIPVAQPANQVPSQVEITQKILVRRGVSPEKISLLGSQHRTTFDEAQSLGGFLETHPNATVLVLTSDFHTRRSRWICRQIVGNQAGQLTFVSAPMESFSSVDWWRTEEGFITISGEYLKLAFYQVRYRPRLMLALLLTGMLAVASWLAWKSAQSRHSCDRR